MIFKIIGIFFRKKVLLWCFLAALTYYTSIFLIIPSNTSFKGSEIVPTDLVAPSIDYMSIQNNEVSKLTTHPTPIKQMMKIMKIPESNITIQKYDAMKVYTDIMKRRISRLTGRLPGTNHHTSQPQGNDTDEKLHIFFAENLNSFAKYKIKTKVNKTANYETVEENLKIAKRSGAGVIIVICSRLSNSLISKTSRIHQTLKSIFYHAPKYGIKVSIAIKEYSKRNVMSIRRDMKIFISNYGTEKALYTAKHGDNTFHRPVIYILSSFLLPQEKLSEIFKTKGKFTLRKTKFDVIALGELREEEHKMHIRTSYFDGLFTSHLLNKESYGSTWKNWQAISSWVKTRGLIWSAGIAEATSGIPAVGFALRTALRCVPRPNFVSITNVPPMDEYLSLTQTWLKKWTNSSITDI